MAECYQDLAYKELSKVDTKSLIAKLKRENREKEIQAELKELKSPKISKELAYLEGKNFDDYLHDIEIVQEYAMRNKIAIRDEILKAMDLEITEEFTTMHNW